jgi:hypothetical protein
MQFVSYICERKDPLTGAAVLLPGATLTVFLAGTSTLASLFNISGAPIGNPITADTNATASFAAPDGEYDIQFVSADLSYTSPKLLKTQIADVLNLTAAGVVVASRSALASVSSPTSGMSRYLAEAGREGWFVFSSTNLATLVTADPQQGLYVAPSGATSGASGAWVRKFDGEYHARWWGFVADNSAGSASANGTAGQAAINMVATVGGAALRFPVGVAYHTGLIFKNKIQYRGSGRDTGSTVGTVLLYTGTGDGVQVNNPINSSTAANISIEGITFKNANRNAGKGCFADTGSTDIKFRQCAFIGSDRGLILDQSELVDVIECDFEGVASQTSMIWIVDGADRNVGASAGFGNRISVQRCQLNGQTGTILIVDDGGGVHAFRDNNYNGGTNQIRAAGVSGLTISGGEFESAAGSNILLHSITLASVSVGSCSPVLFDSPVIVPTTGQSCVFCSSGGQLTFIAAFLGNTTAQKVVGTGNVSGIYAFGIHNGGGGSNFDGLATFHVEFDSYGLAISNIPQTYAEIAAASVATPAAGRQTLFIDSADHKLKRKDSTGTVTIIA